MLKKITHWLQRNRTSVRLAFMLGLSAKILSVALSLLWSRLLLRAMGDSLNGLFIAFQGVTRLGGFGDLGTGGIVSIRVGQMLGEGNESKLKKFLANARGVFLTLGLATLLIPLALSPWLPGWLRFENVTDAGSLTALFAVGAVSVGLFIVSLYFSCLNYAHGTVVWPVLPAIILGQLSVASQWMLAKAHAPLWVQYLPYIAVSILALVLSKKMLDWSHPYLGKLTPLRYDWPEWRSLFGASGWVCLCTLGNLIYTTTDRLVINAGFGPAILPKYYYNYKLCEYAVIVVGTASSVSIPKITQWLASKKTADQQRALVEINRLNQFQTILGCAAALFYFAVNDFFIRFWLGDNYHAPFFWQAAFALNLAVTAGGDASIQVAGRCGQNGIRAAGIFIGSAGILNLALAILSARLHSITGIPFATVIAQSFLNLMLGRYICRHLNLPVIHWLAKTWVIPLTVVLAAAGLKMLLPEQSFLHIGTLLGCYTVLLLGTAWLVGVKKEMLRAEWATIRTMLKI